MKIKTFHVVILLTFYLSVYSQNKQIDPEPKQDTYKNGDWLLDGSSYKAGLYNTENSNNIVLVGITLLALHERSCHYHSFMYCVNWDF